MSDERFRLPLLSSAAGGPVSGDVVASRFLPAFQCAAGRCEDLCCHDWMIAYDKPSYDRLQAVMSTTEAGARSFEERLQLGDGTQPGAAFAYIRPKADGWCAFIRDDHLCEIQAEHGEEMLSETCSIFPRTSTAIGDRVELGGSLACPEVARHLLLHDGAGDFVASSATLMTRARVGKRVEVASRDEFDLIRGTALSLLDQVGVPFASRLAAVADMARRVDALRERTHLERELAAATAPATLASVGKDFEALKVPLESMVQLCAQILIERRRMAHSDRYERLVVRVFESLQAEALGRPPSRDDSVPLDRLAAVYHRRRALLGALADRPFKNYALDFWRSHPFTEAPNLLEYVCRLELRLGVLRLLFLGHPDVVAFLQTGDDAETLDHAAVEVVQVFVRAFEHAPAFSRIVDSAQDQGAATAFSRAIILAKLY